jgi:predicted  nucleic acid-binding Zn-ribbon protein
MHTRMTSRVVSTLLLLAVCVPTVSFAQQKKGNEAAIQRQAEQIRRLSEAQQALQAENSNLAAQKMSLEEELKAGRDRLEAAKRQDDTRVTALRRELQDGNARAAALGTELEQARRDLARQNERLAATEQQLAALREQAGTLQASLRVRDESLVRSRASEESRLADLQQCRDHNGALASLAGDLLTAIDRGGLGGALVGTQPFDGFKRIHIETLIRGYRDQVADNRVGPAGR